MRFFTYAMTYGVTPLFVFACLLWTWKSFRFGWHIKSDNDDRFLFGTVFPLILIVVAIAAISVAIQCGPSLPIRITTGG